MQYVSQRNKSSRGNAIILILPFAIVAVALIQLNLFRSANFTKAVTNFRVTGVRDNLVSNIKAYASMPATFRSSLHPSLPAGTNGELQNCILGGGPSLCQADMEMPVALYYPLSSSSLTPSSPLRMISGRAAIGGTSSPAALYDIRGNLCSTTGQASNECPFEVVTTFSATCAGAAPSCATAESITVHYIVKRYKDSSFLLGALRESIDQKAPIVAVAKILPGNEDSTTGNVMISSLMKTTNGTSVVPGAELLAQINDSVKASGIEMSAENQDEMVQAFLSAGYTDSTFITEMTKATYWLPNTIEMITSIGKMGITDVKTATFLAAMAVPDTGWMQTVLDSGVTNAFLAGNLQGAIGNGNSALLASVVNAMNGLPQNVITLAIAAKKITDSAVAQQMYNTVAPLVSDGWVGWGLIEGGWYTDPARMSDIITATAGISSTTAGALAKLGVTDAALAQQIQSIVSVIPDDPWPGFSIIQENGLNPTLIQAAVDQYMASLSNTSTAAAPATASTSTTTTTTTGSSGTTGTSTTVTVDSMVSICTTCSGVTF